MKKLIKVIWISFIMVMMTGLLVLADDDVSNTSLQVWPEGASFDEDYQKYSNSVTKTYTPDEIQSDPVLEVKTNSQTASLQYSWEDDKGTVLQSGDSSAYKYTGKKNSTIKCTVTDGNNESKEVFLR